MFLCATHPEPQNCCAIEYSLHSLDGAAAVLSSNKAFPSRVTVKEKAQKHFKSLCRRLYRIMAHCFHHHRDTFDLLEAETHTSTRFRKLVTTYSLMDEASLNELIPEQ